MSEQDDEAATQRDVIAQREEIAAALKGQTTAEQRFVRVKLANPSEGSDEWDEWAQNTQDSIDKLISDSRTFRIGLLGIGVVSLAAVGISALTAKIVSEMHKGLKQLGDNQIEIGNILVNSGVIPVSTMTGEPINRPSSAAKDLGVDPDAPVADAQDTGPAGEASQRQRDLMAADGPMNGKGADPTTDPINPRHLNTGTRIQAKPAEPA